MQHHLPLVCPSHAFTACRLHADVVPGCAATDAEQSKLHRYGPTVLPIAFEPCGRLGYKSLESIAFLQQEAMVWGTSQFVARASFRHWRRELETVVSYQLADAALICLGRSAQKFTTLLAR